MCLTAEGKQPVERQTGRLKKGRKEQMKRSSKLRVAMKLRVKMDQDTSEKRKPLSSTEKGKEK